MDIDVCRSSYPSTDVPEIGGKGGGDPSKRRGGGGSSPQGGRIVYPKGKTLPPFCDYAAEVTHECRRGVGADACGRAQALGGTISERRLRARLANLTAMQRKSNPFIQFTSAAPVTGTAVVAMVAPLPPPSPRLTLMDIVLHMQRQCRRRIIQRHRAACAVQQCYRLRHARRAAAATVLQQRARGYRMLSCAALADATTHTSQAHLESDACSTTAVFGGRQPVASLSDSSSPLTPSTWRPLSAGDLGPPLTLSTSRPPSRAASQAGSDPGLTFDEKDITGDGDSVNPLAYCAYLKNVRIAQTWEDGKRRRYRVNSACCWIRSTIADPGAGPLVIGERLLHALPPDAVVRHRPCTPRLSPVVGPGGERLLMLGTVSIVFTVEGHPYTHRFEIVDFVLHLARSILHVSLPKTSIQPTNPTDLPLTNQPPHQRSCSSPNSCNLSRPTLPPPPKSLTLTPLLSVLQYQSSPPLRPLNYLRHPNSPT